MQKYFLKSRRIDWKETNKEKTIKYAQILSENYGSVGIRRLHLKITHINRFIKGLSEEELYKEVFKCQKM